MSKNGMRGDRRGAGGAGGAGGGVSLDAEKVEGDDSGSLGETRWPGHDPPFCRRSEVELRDWAGNGSAAITGR